MTLHPHTIIGHVHLTVANIDRSLSFYRDILWFEITMHYGDSAVFLCRMISSSHRTQHGKARVYHHHLLAMSGLYHFAILFPSRLELAKALKRLIDAGYPLDGASDHGVSEALHLRDPDNIGVELYCDRPRKHGKYQTMGKLRWLPNHRSKNLLQNCHRTQKKNQKLFFSIFIDIALILCECFCFSKIIRRKWKQSRR